MTIYSLNPNGFREFLPSNEMVFLMIVSLMQVKLVCLSYKVESEIDQQSSIFPYGENKEVNSGCQRVFI